MSRTIRRKNGYEEKYYINTYDRNDDGVWGYIPLEGKDYWKGWHDYHGDNHCNAYTPSKYYRNRRETAYRIRTKEELHRYKVNPNYEVNLPHKPGSHMWDWS